MALEGWSGFLLYSPEELLLKFADLKKRGSYRRGYALLYVLGSYAAGQAP